MNTQICQNTSRPFSMMLLEIRQFNAFMTQCDELSIELDFGVVDYPSHGSNSDELLKYGRAALEQAISIEHSSLVFYSSQLRISSIQTVIQLQV